MKKIILNFPVNEQHNDGALKIKLMNTYLFFRTYRISTCLHMKQMKLFDWIESCFKVYIN